MKRLNKMIFVLVLCLSVIFVTGTSRGGVVSITWSGTVTASASAGDVSNSDTETYSAHAVANYRIPTNRSTCLCKCGRIGRSDCLDGASLDSENFGIGSTAGFSMEGVFTIGSSPDFRLERHWI